MFIHAFSADYTFYDGRTMGNRQFTPEKRTRLRPRDLARDHPEQFMKQNATKHQGIAGFGIHTIFFDETCEKNHNIPGLLNV